MNPRNIRSTADADDPARMPYTGDQVGHDVIVVGSASSRTPFSSVPDYHGGIFRPSDGTRSSKQLRQG
jgi:hypothetical protein